MKHKFLVSLRALTLLLVMSLSIGNVWGAWTDLSESLDLTGKSYGTSGYSGTLAYGDWTIVNGANNNKQWTYFKMGGKKATISSANPCYIYYSANSGVSSQVDSITVHIPSGSLSKNGMSVNSWGVYVYSDKAMTSQVDYVAGGTISNAAADFGFKPSAGKTWAKAYYYKVSWDLANTTTTNGIVCVDKITLHANGGGGSEPELSVSPETITFNPVDVGTESVDGKDVTVTMANLDAVLIGFSTNSPFQVDKDKLTASGTITVTPTAATLATAGEYADNLTITDGDKLEKTVAVSIKVNALSAPNFTTQPVGASYEKDATPTALSVVAEGAPSPTYQWYSNTTESTSEATKLTGETNAMYTPNTATIGTTYYYCVATNSQGKATSDIVAVEIIAALPSITIQQVDAGISGTYSTSTFKKNEVTFGFNQWCTSTTFIQAKKEITGSLYNSDAIPGNIRSIEFVTGSNKTPRTVIVKAGLTSDASSMTEITAPAESMNMVYDFGSTTKYKYFQMSTPSNACYFDKIIIKYELSTDPSIVVTPKPRHFEALDNASCDSVFNIAAGYLTGSMEAIIIGDNADKFSAGDIVDNKVTVTFTPGAIGNFSAKLVVKSMKSDIVEASDTVILTGEGLNSNIPVTGVLINKQELSLEKGANEILTVTITPDNASVKTVTWSSDNTEVATVNAESGLVTALKKGTANIIATSNNGIKDTCVVTVTLPAYWEKVTAAKDNWAGEYLLVYENNNTAYVWTGIDNALCYNDTTITDGQIMQPSGTVTVTLAAMDGGYSMLINGGTNNGKYLSNGSKAAMSFGTTALAFTPSYATNCTQLKYNSTSNYLRFNSSSDQMRFRFYAESGQKAIQLYEKASTEPSVKLNKKETSLTVGAKETLTATVKNSEATVVWSTSDASKATVENGVVTAVAAGTATITAKITDGEEYSATCEVTVTPAATVTSVTIAPQDATLYIYGTTKQTKNFTATVEGENNPAQTVTWKSLNEDVATVSEAGVVSAVAAGTVKIVAISTVNETKSDTADVVVKVFENTAETAYTTAEAIELIDALGSAIKDIQVYVKGIVSKNDGLSSGTITYWLDEDAFEVYKGKSFEGNDFTSVDDIKVNDKVVVKGKLKKYVGTTTIYEFDANSQLISRKTAAVLTWSKGAYTAPLGAAEYDYPVLTTTPTDLEGVVYSSSNTNAATIDASTGVISLVAEGTTTIKASFAGSETLDPAVDATYTLTVAAAVQYYTITYNANGGSEVAAVPGQTNLPSTFPTSTKDFKVFGGWYFDNGVFEVPAVADMPLTKDTTLYAKWDEPKSVTEMLALIPESGDEVENVYGWGYIKAGASVSFGYANYYITDGSDNDFYIYKGLNINGESFTGADQLPSGNKVMIYGDIKNYNGTPEFAQGSRIINNASVTVPVTGVTLDKENAEVMIGKKVSLVATVAPSHASNQNVIWSSNKESIATVSATGVVTGVTEGEATITVTTEDGGFQASCTVTVVAAPTFDNGIWVKVTNTADLTADSYVIIAAKSYGKAIKTFVSGNNHGAQDVTVSGEILSYTTAPAIFQVKDYVKSEATVGKAFLNIESGNYLYLPDNNNKLTETASMEDKSAFTFVITDGIHTLTNYSLTGRQMKYNNGSTCFACYTSGQDNIVVYKYMEGAFALSFDANGGQKTSVPGSMIVQGAVTIPSDVPTHATAGTVFAYYTPDQAGEGTHYAPGQENCVFTQNNTLYAQWNVLTARHITYNAGGGVGSVPTDASNYYEGNEVTLKTASNLSNPGHVFASWLVTYNNGIKLDTLVVEEGKFTMPDFNVTATAQWTAKTNDKWVLVTSEDQLVAGDKYVLASNAKSAVSGTLGSGYFTKANATFSDNKAYIIGMVNQQELILGGSTGAWTFKKDDSNFLTNSSESLSLSATATTWTISFSENNVSIVADNETLKFNATANPQRFKTYKTYSGSAVQLYRKIPAIVVEDETVNASDLNDYANITVGEGGNLTLTSGEKALGDVYVMAGGKVTIEAEATLTVTNFVIKSVKDENGGKSGQVAGVTASNLVIEGDAYYDVTLDGKADPDKWHAVGVPFDVDAINGIYDLNDNKLTNEQNYAVMVYQGDVRAKGKYGWIKLHKTSDKIMHPGVFYLFGVDGTKGTTYRFKMNGGFSVASKSINVYEYPQTSGVTTDAGWNGIANNQLEYSYIDKQVQVLNIDKYVFEAKTASSTNFTVGTPFFYQAEETGSVTLVTGTDKTAYAPVRYGAKEIKDLDVTLANEDYTDHLYISSTDEAANEYQIGRDLTKMTMTNSPIVPQIFAKAYGTNLCMIDAPMVNKEAEVALKLYAPKAGEYTIAAEQTGASVYLKKGNAIVWDLSLGEYTITLPKGNTEGYSIVVKAPQVTTDLQNIYDNQVDGAEKVIYRNRLYIFHNGNTYDAQGCLVK